MATPDELTRQKDLLPTGWGRFGKAIDAIGTIAAPDEALVAACVTLNPSFQHRAIGLAGGLMELGSSTNVVVAATDRRMLIVPTSFGGSARDHAEVPYAGLEVVDADKKQFTLRWSEGQVLFKGAAKPMVGPLIEALRARATPAA